LVALHQQKMSALRFGAFFLLIFGAGDGMKAGHSISLPGGKRRTN
jgi:hypothetical protein